MDEETRAILNELAHALSDALERSRGVASSVRRLQGLGFEVGIYLEATILLGKKDGEARPRGARTQGRRIRAGSLKLSEKDLKFLKALKIALHAKETTARPPGKRER